MLRVSKSRAYLVPIVMRTIDILELLFKSEISLKANEVSKSTSIPHSTAYRILRTLVHRGYLAQDVEGRFRISSRLARPGAMSQNGHHAERKNDIPVSVDLSGDQVIEIVVGVLRSLKESNGRPLNGHRESAPKLQK